MPEELSFKVQDDLNEAVRIIGFLKGRGGFLLLGFSGPKAHKVVVEFLEEQLKKSFHLKKVFWQSGIKDLTEIFPLSNPLETVYLVMELEKNFKENGDRTLTLLNLTREFYSRHKKIVIYCLPTDIVYKEIQWKAADFWSFRTASFDFFLEEDYRAMIEEKVKKDLKGYVRETEKTAYLESLLKEERRKEKPDKSKLGNILSKIGFSYINQDKYKEALKYFEESLVLFRKLKYKKGELFALDSIGQIYSYLGQQERALKYLEEALLLSREIEDKQEEADELGHIGEIYNKLSQYVEAFEYYEKALTLNREIGDKYGEANQLIKIGAIIKNFGQPQKALKFYENALSYFREVGDKEWEAPTLGNIGQVYRDLDHPEKALKYYEEALALARGLGDRSEEANQLGNIGLFYRDSQPDKALKYYDEALILARELGFKSREAECLHGIGQVYQLLGQPVKALKYLREALEIFKEIGAKGMEELILNEIEKLNP